MSSSKKLTKKSIAIHLPVFRRYDAQVLSYDTLTRLRTVYEKLGYTTTLYVVGSQSQDRELAEMYNADGYIQRANRPLGAKFNALVQHMIEEQPDFDYFMEWTSDNCVTSGFVKAFHAALKSGADVAYTDAFYVTTLERTNGLIFSGGNSNVGRITKGSVIRKAFAKHGELYSTYRNTRLDVSMLSLVKKYTRDIVCVDRGDTPMLLDVKDVLSMHSFDSYKGRGRKIVPLIGDFPEYEKHNELWRKQQEKLGPIKSGSTSAPPPAQAATPEELLETTPQKQAHMNSSPAPRPEPSAAASKSSTRRRKTMTGKGKSSRADSNGT